MTRSSLLAYYCTAILLLCSSMPLHAENPNVRITTNMGIIDVELFADKAPVTVKNILQSVDNGFYSDTIFHRVINGFMIQGGGYGTDNKRKPTTPPIHNEAYNGMKNLKGTLAMARTSDPHSATTQFFINVNDNVSLDYKTAPYGPMNTLIRSQLGVQDIQSGRVATSDCNGQAIDRNSLKQAQDTADNPEQGYSCLMQAILNDKTYSIDNELKTCLANMDTLKESGKLGIDQTCSDYINQRHQGIKFVYVYWGYTVFGKVTAGYDIVELIKGVETGASGPFIRDAPIEQVVIQSIQRI